MHHHIHRRQDFPWGSYTKCYKKKLKIEMTFLKYITQRKKNVVSLPVLFPIHFFLSSSFIFRPNAGARLSEQRITQNIERENKTRRECHIFREERDFDISLFRYGGSHIFSHGQWRLGIYIQKGIIQEGWNSFIFFFFLCFPCLQNAKV